MKDLAYFLTPEDIQTAKENGIPEHIAHNRFYYQAMFREDAITMPYTPKDKEKARWAKRAEKNGISSKTFYDRIRPKKPGERGRQWGYEEAATTPVMSRAEVAKISAKTKLNKFTVEQMERAKATGNWNTIRNRVNNLGWDVERAINAPVNKQFIRKDLRKDEKSESVR